MYKVTGDVFLDDGFKAEGAVSLSGAEIGGQLNCDGGHFNNAGGDALSAQGVKVTGGVFLRGGFKAEGKVSLSGAEIGGQLNCVDGHFNNKGGGALNVENLVAGSWFWRDVASVSGRVQLAGAKIGDLVDDAASWDKVDDLQLDGFSYQHIHGPVDAEMRLAWVAKGSIFKEVFSPQPYEQLAKVLRKMGHVADAREVLYEKEKRLKQARRDRIWQRRMELPLKGWRGEAVDFKCWLGDGWLALKNTGLAGLVGYGYYPWRSFWCLVGLITIATYVFDRTYEAGDFDHAGVAGFGGGWLGF